MTMTRINGGIVALILLTTATAQADAPARIPVQGALTNAEGQVVDGSITLTMSLYDSPNGSGPFYTESQQVEVDLGNFTVYLGAGGTLDLTQFRDRPQIYVGFAVNTDPEMKPRLELGSVPYAGFAQYCADASSLGGKPADDYNFTAGTGISIDGSTINVDSSMFQQRITGTCAAGLAIQSIDATGAVTCTSTGVTYTAGDGLTANGSQFAVDTTVARLVGNQSFDSGTFYVDADSDRVGVGDTTPSYKLDVNGDARATGDMVTDGDFRYSAARTHYKWIGAQQFIVDPFYQANYRYHTLGFLYPQGDVYMYMYAPVELPDGADVTVVSCYYYDNDSTTATPDNIEDLDFYLRSRPYTSASVTTLATATGAPTSGASTTVLSVTDSTVSGSGDPIDNSAYAYNMYVYMDMPPGSACTSNCRFYGCRITYTLSELRPGG